MQRVLRPEAQKNRRGELTWTEFDGEGVAGAEDGIADGEAGRIFVALDGCGVAFQLDDLTDELVPADLDKLVHLAAAHVFGDDQGTGDLVDLAVLGC